MTTYNYGGQTIHSYRKYNSTTGNFEKDGHTVKAMGEKHRQSQNSIDIYNVMMARIKERNDRSPERQIMAKVLQDRGEIRLLYSLLIN